MSEGQRFWLSPHRGLPSPTGRLGNDMDFPAPGAIKAPWLSGGGANSLPPPQYLQSRDAALEAIQTVTRTARFRHELSELVGLKRRAEKVALHFVAVLFRKGVDLVDRLDSLGDHAKVQGMAEPDHRRTYGRVAAVRRHVAHERLIDLQPIDREMLKPVER